MLKHYAKINDGYKFLGGYREDRHFDEYFMCIK